MPIVIERRHDSAGELLDVLTRELTERLEEALHGALGASLLVSGGRTPAALFERLASLPLAWRRVGIGLVDERCVPAWSEDSNERLVRTRLLQNRAAAAHFIPMMNDAPPAARADAAWQALQALPRPFDAVLLGMGEDGHTASWFPGAANLSGALDPAAPPGCLGITPPTAPHERLTVNISAALQTRQVIVLINGAKKWQVYEQARTAGPIEELPIRAILHQRHAPVEVWWSP